MRRTLALLAFAPLVAAVPRDAFANAAARDFYNEEGARAGYITDSTPIVVDAETLLIDCSAPRTPCRFVAAYAIHNPSPVEEGVEGVFYGEPESGEGMTITMNGADVTAKLEANAVARIDEKHVEHLRAHRAQGFSRINASELSRKGFRFTLAPGAKAELRFEGILASVYYSNESSNGGYTASAMLTRHPFTLFPKDESYTAKYRYLVSPIRTWAGAPNVRVTIKSREQFIPIGEVTRWNLSGNEATTTFNSRDVATLEFGLRKTTWPVQLAVPALGVGGRLDTEDLVVRGAIEVGIGEGNGIASVVVDTNFETNVTVAPTFEVASPSLFFIFPSLSAGLGAPIRVEDKTRVGGRVQIGATWPVFGGIVFPVDFYPSADANGSRWDLSLLYRFSM